MTRKTKAALIGLATLAVAVPATLTASAQTTSHHPARRCEQKFDEAQRVDMESFRDFDAETFREGHDPEAVSIFPSGFMATGIDEIMTALNGHFTNENAVWSWTELNRRVDGCKTAFIVYDATYDIPSAGFHQRALTVVTYIYERGHWLSIMDQGTMLELEE